MPSRRRRLIGFPALCILLLLTAAFVWWFLSSEFMAMDRCLDSGGRWDEGEQCQFEPAPE